jgi:hypothetical protein
MTAPADRSGAGAKERGVGTRMRGGGSLKAMNIRSING